MYIDFKKLENKGYHVDTPSNNRGDVIGIYIEAKNPVELDWSPMLAQFKQLDVLEVDIDRALGNFGQGIELAQLFKALKD